MDKLLTLVLCIALVFMLIGVLPVHGEEAIYDSVIRLHVLADSDGAEDQRLKLVVRDAVLSYASELLSDATTREEASMTLAEHLAELESVARAALDAEGCSDAVAVVLGDEDYPTRYYASCAFPSGRYLSLRVLIGDAVGQNFWCVLFPSLCVTAAEGSAVEIGSSLASLGLSGEQYRIITDTDGTTYRVRFKLLEVFEELVG